MNIYLIFLLAIVALGTVAGIITVFSKKTKGEPDVIQPTSGDCSTCKGDDGKCEQVCAMEAATKAPEYYDDEELDVYAGRPSDAYTDKEAEEFANVLYTMKEEEAKGWNRSLIVRGINVPDQIKDELIAMISQ